MFKKISLLIVNLLLCSFIFAQTINSTQGHDGKVNYICNNVYSADKSTSFYSVGNDGFIIKWAKNGSGEHYQVSNLFLQKIAENPATADISVYETDGISIHRVRTLKSSTFEQQDKPLRFSDSVSAIAYSEKGNYLIVATTAVNGIYIYNAKTLSLLKQTTDVPSVVSYIKTSATERTAVMYSPSGAIIYYDLSGMRQKVKIQTEDHLEQVMVFGNGEIDNRFLAGVKDGTIYIIDATNGKIIGMYTAKNPYLISSKLDTTRQGLYYITNDGKSNYLNLIGEATLKKLMDSTGSNVLNPESPELIKNFSGLKGRDTISYVSKNGSLIIIGTSGGNIYTMSDVVESEAFTLNLVTESMNDKIYDITSEDDGFYLLTRDSVYKTSYETKTISTICKNNGSRNLVKNGNSVILWSKDSRNPVYYFNAESGTTSILFTPSNTVRNLRLFNDKIIYTLGTSSVCVYDLTSKTNTEYYSGTSIQDAILVDDNTIYVAKAKINQNDSAIITVNLATKEYVGVNFAGSVVFSLSYDEKNSNGTFYGIVIKQVEGIDTTEVFSYNTQTKAYNVFIRNRSEDNKAFTYFNDGYIFTNLGQNVIYSQSIANKKLLSYKRSASIPMKVATCDNYIGILNYNGSITWYDNSSTESLGDWYLQLNGDWIEY